jgi:hypothetical protein
MQQPREPVSRARHDARPGNGRALGAGWQRVAQLLLGEALLLAALSWLRAGLVAMQVALR